MSMYIELCVFSFYINIILYYIKHHVLQEVVVWELVFLFFLECIEHMMIEFFHL
jgi:hypothetical protein